MSGLARRFDITDQFNQYNTSDSSLEADLLSIQNDWETVGDDLRKSIENYKIKIKK